MIEIFSHFMHIYFWVFIGAIVIELFNYDKIEPKYSVSLETIIAFVLFIMSFNY